MNPGLSSPGVRVLLSRRGELWSALADRLLLEIRRGLRGEPCRLRVAAPSLTDAALYARATRRFGFTLGDRDLGSVTLPALLERHLEVGGRLDLLLATGGEAGRQTEQVVTRLASRAGRCDVRGLARLDQVLVTAPGFAFLAPSAIGSSDNAAGVLATGEATTREFAAGFEGLWQVAGAWAARRGDAN